MPSTPFKPFSEGSSFKAYCSALAGTPPFRFQWFLNDKPIDHSNKYFQIETRQEDSFLKIESVKLEYQGTFKCEAVDGLVKDSVNFELSVIQPLKWSKEPQDEQIFIGRPVHIECFAEGSPPPRISWRRVGKDLVIDHSVLSTVSADREFAGEYECTVNNGQDVPLTRKITVRISTSLVPCVASYETSGGKDEIPEISKLLSNVEVRETEEFSFICSLRRRLRPIDFSWLKNGLPLTNPNVKIANIQDVSMITINRVEASDAGNYTSKAANKVGHDLMTLQLKVNCEYDNQ
ncbi:Titin [Halotydeus destructor]|nr:Titin [Halotydeus destructor]